MTSKNKSLNYIVGRAFQPNDRDLKYRKVFYDSKYSKFIIKSNDSK